MVRIIMFLMLYCNIVFSQETDILTELDSARDIFFHPESFKDKNLLNGLGNIYLGSIFKQGDSNKYYSWLLLKEGFSLKDTIIWLENIRLADIKKGLPLSFQPIPEDTENVDEILLNRAKLMSFYYGRYDSAMNMINSPASEIMHNPKYDFNNSAVGKYFYFSNILNKPKWTIHTDDEDYFRDVSILALANDKLLIKQYDLTGEISLKSIKKIEYKSGLNSFIGGVIGSSLGLVVSLATIAIISSERNNSVWVWPVFIFGIPASISLGGIIGASIGSSYSDVEINLQEKKYYDNLFKLKKETYFAIPDSSKY